MISKMQRKCQLNGLSVVCMKNKWANQKTKIQKALAKTRFQIINGTFIYKHVYFIHHYLIASKMT